MTRPSTWFLCLSLLTVTTAYAVFTGGADDPFSFAVTVGLLGLVGIAGGLLLFQAGPASRSERRINWAAFGFILYVAFQLVPLPVGLLRVIDPTRYEIATALSDITGAVHYAPLTVAPPTTWIHLSRICGYAIAFFVARQLVRRSPFGPWTAVMPLVFIAGTQAAYGFFVGPDTAGHSLSGSYPNRNHFAGLLEMALPLSIGFAVSVLYRSGRRGVLAMTDVLKASAPLAIALLLFSAILYSNSKGGAVASLLSLFFMTAMWLGRGQPSSRRWPFLALLTLLLLVVFIFLTPSNLVERFGEAATQQNSEGRIPIWRDTIHLIAAYPMFGVGFGAFFPTFLRYQFAGVGFAWTNTHNDYLQLLSELGIVGFIAPSLLLMSLFGRAVDAASEPEATEARFVGLACAGGLLAILVHSLTDFNTYVTSNGLVLAWMAGVAATLGPSAAEGYSPSPEPRRVGYGVAPAVGLLGALSVSYGGAWVQFLNHYQGNAAAEARFCRFGVCDTQGVLTAQLIAAREAQPDRAVTLDPKVLSSYLNRDRSAPYRWDEFGEALSNAGRRDEARKAFEHAVRLGPTSSSTLVMASEFAFDDGRERDGFELASRALAADDPQIYDAVFSVLDAKQVGAARIVSSVAMDRTAGTSLLRRQLRADPLSLESVRCVWEWAVDRGFVDDPLAREYTGVLLANKQSREAWTDWVRYAKSKEDGYPEKNLVFNGNFAREPTGSPFDWQISPVAGVKAVLEREPSARGTMRTLRLTFDGTHNVGDVGVAQRVSLTPGTYVLRAKVRTEGLTTDQGVAIKVRTGLPSTPDESTQPFTGATAPTDVELPFEIPSEADGVTIALSRKPSLRFDRLVRGTFWLEAVSLVRAMGGANQTTAPHDGAAIAMRALTN